MRWTGAVTVVLLLAACGGGQSGGQQASEPLLPQQVAAEVIGCNLFEETQTDELYVERQGRCQIDADWVTISTFSNNDARDNWLEAAREFGGPYFAGDRYVAFGEDNPDVTEALADRAEGEVVR